MLVVYNNAINSVIATDVVTLTVSNELSRQLLL